jgi:hypothetical protein
MAYHGNEERDVSKRWVNGNRSQPCGQGTFESIAQQNKNCRLLAKDPEDIRRTGILGTLGSDIDTLGCRYRYCEADASQQVGSDQCEWSRNQR